MIKKLIMRFAEMLFAMKKNVPFKKILISSGPDIEPRRNNVMVSLQLLKEPFIVF